MAETKNLCAQIPLELHAKVCGEREQREQTTSQYITELLMEYYKMKENGGKTTMANNGSRTMAFQIPEELFQRIKQHLERESARSGRKVTPSCVSPRTAATGTGTATGSPTLSPSRYAALWRSAVRSSPGRAASWPR